MTTVDQPDNDEPCMCGTDFTCMADEHDYEVANLYAGEVLPHHRRIGRTAEGEPPA